MISAARLVTSLVGLLAFAASNAVALPITVDTFEDGTTLGWLVPGASPVPPLNISSGGPAGAGDNYLQLQALGNNAPGGRLSVLNTAQWTGDYRAAGLTSISMDVINTGPDDVTLRLLFEDFEGMGPPVNLALTLADIVVPASSGWINVVFDLSAANLGALIGSAETALSNVDTLRIFHNPDPTFPGPFIGIPPVTVTLGVDNITPIFADVPEPATGALLLFAAVAWRLKRRR